MALALSAWLHSFGIVRFASTRWRLDRIFTGTARAREAAALGAGPNGDPGERTRPPARAADRKSHSCRSARCQGCVVGDGGRAKMFLPLGRRRGIVGRPQNARFYRDPPARICFGAQRHALLAGTTWRPCKFKRRPNALAGRQRAVAKKRARSACARFVRLGCRAVPGARISARQLPARA